MKLDNSNRVDRASKSEMSETEKAHFDDPPAALARDDFDRNVWCLAGIPVDISNIDQALAALDQAVRDRRRLSFVTPNVNWLARAAENPEVRQELVNADLSLVDGAPLAAIARWLGVPIQSRVAGSDLFEALRKRPAYLGKKLRVFFFGGRDGAAEAAAKAVNDENGGVQSIGWLNPGFGSVEEMSRPEIIKSINQAKPDFVLVALGAGKGQRWIEANQDALDVPVIAHLGAVVDFTAGGISRAPNIVRRLGMEWAWRIKEEPSLWRRYAQDALALVGILWTRIRPQWGKQFTVQPSVMTQAVLKCSENELRIELQGDFHHKNLDELRRIFRQAAAASGDVILEFANIGSFDRSFLGLILMLEKHTSIRGAKLFVEGANVRQLKVLKANDMRYPSYKPVRRKQANVGENSLRSHGSVGRV